LFDDLDQAASIRDYAILFEANTVLGQSAKQIAAQAWDFDGLAMRYNTYLKACAEQPNKVFGAFKPSAALDAARHELFEYLNLMQADPLLPAELLPEDYLGPRVVAAFRSRVIALIGRFFSP
jgi:DNA-binding transcriptional regulator PaaX